MELISIHALREEGDINIWKGVSERPNFYPRPPRGGRRRGQQARGVTKSISIHALREEGDTLAMTLARTYKDFYPRPPRGGRPPSAILRSHSRTFLSTPSARRATIQRASIDPNIAISIHALREEGDASMVRQILLRAISIHALREEGDSSRLMCSPSTSYFYPRPPRGGRQQKQRQNLYFQTNYTTFCTNLEEP